MFSQKDRCWKIGDFGTASEATSKRLNTTRYSRGTTGYRAPEILVEGKAQFNNKVDIFALGCIVYEIVTGRKLFSEDWRIRQYALTGQLTQPILWPGQSDSSFDRVQYLEMLVASMLEIDPCLRPGAPRVHAQIGLIRSGLGTENVVFERVGVPIQVTGLIHLRCANESAT